MRGSWLAMTILIGCGSLHRGYVYSQTPQPLGSVAAADAEVTTAAPGVVPVAGGVAKLAGASTITANPGRNAQVSLARGGDVLVCQTSVLHATPAGDALVLALDRGAMEIHRRALSTDVVMTPDMRISPAEAGSLDLRLRVTFNGDTCIENRGHKAPPLNITDAFGETTYQLKPGQHVMFEHGSLREVVDRETTPCGCPPPEKPGVSLADALLNGGRSDSGQGKITPQQAAAAHPFPTAVSDGLAPPTPVPAETPAEGTHVQIATTLTFDPNAAAAAGPVPTTVPAAKAAAQPAPTPEKTGPFHAIGHFFKRVFAH